MRRIQDEKRRGLVHLQKQKDIKVNLLNGNTEQIETALINKEIEIGIVEGQSKNQSIKYVPFIKDELVLVCNTQNPLVKQNEISLEDLKSMKFITRERGSGTLEVIEYSLKQVGVKISDLQIEMQLGSTESIKARPIATTRYKERIVTF